MLSPESMPGGSERSHLQCDIRRKLARKGEEPCRVGARTLSGATDASGATNFFAQRHAREGCFEYNNLWPRRETDDDPVGRQSGSELAEEIYCAECHVTNHPCPTHVHRW